ncbi:MAG TPA: HU family DNA-binding protein [Acidimicrobiales bacterium]|nr:HU family DNA-binding protein [Acidimicrobiales bacterium]
MAVNRTELVDSVSGKTGLDKKQSEAAVSAVADAVMAEIKAGNKVSLFGFGTFSPTARAARMGRNPQTGAPVKIAASKGVRFAPASAFKEVLNSRGGSKAAAGKKATTKTAAAKKSAPAKKAGKKSAPAKKSATAKKAAKSAKKR